MTYEEILYSVSGRVATVTLHRPQKLNAWTLRMEEEVEHAIRQAAEDDDVRVIVLTGAGRGFCAGADMSLLSSVVGQKEGERSVRQHTWMQEIPKPLIAAINGPCVGLGMVLAMYCDLRFASSTATFSTVFSRRGLVAEYGLAWMLPKLVGLGNAMDLLLSARSIGADEAERMGFANRVFPAEGFGDAVGAYARELAEQTSPRSLRVIKAQIYSALSQSLPEALELAVNEMWASFATEDFREGVAHFLEKRPPRFTGR